MLFKLVKKQKPFTEPHAKSLEPDLGSKTTSGFKTWFLFWHSSLELLSQRAPSFMTSAK